MSNVILVLDSSKEILLLLKEVLSSKGVVYTVEDGPSALRFLSGNSLPVVFVINPLLELEQDYNMLDYLRSSRLYNKIPIILLSDQSETCLQNLTEEFGCAAYFRKPFDPLSLSNVVDSILEQC